MNMVQFMSPRLINELACRQFRSDVQGEESVGI